ncbi:MAG: sigma-70 family RNA polymerase sigma factor [Acidimicrobiales bacterium]
MAAALAVASDSDEGTPETLERDRCNRETVFQRRRDVNARMTASVGDRLRDGDESALEETYRRLGPLVRDYVQRFVPRDDAEDIVQITFLELWRARKRYDPSRSLEGFVFGIARDRSIDHLRRRRHDVVDVDHLRNLIGDDGRELVERLVWAAEVRGALGELPEVQREALEMSYFDHRTQTEIAHQLGVPIGTVKARMARGMQRLASLIGGVEQL